MSKTVVHLRVYKSNGRDNQISYSADGSVQNENILVKLTHDTLEWSNYLKHLLVNGFVKVEVEKAIGDVSVESLQKDVDVAMHPIEEVVLSPEQQKIADLEAKLDALIGKSDLEEIIEEKPVKDDKDELARLRLEYKDKIGKRAFPGWSIEQLVEKMK